MEDGKTNTTDTQGIQPNSIPPTTPVTSKEEEDFNPVLAEAKSLAERIEEGNKKSDDLLRKQERLLAEQALGGNSGGMVQVKSHIETPKEYNERIDKEISEGMHGD